MAEQLKRNQQTAPPEQTEATAPSTEPGQSSQPVLPGFAEPMPIPSKPPSTPADGQAVTSTTPGTGVTITEDEAGNQDIRPNWTTDGLPDGSMVVPAEPEPNMGGSGGGKMDMGSDGAYHGDHPGEAPKTQATSTPDSQPETPPEQTTPPKDTPAPDKPSGGDSTPHNGQISEDGTKMWFEGFGWIENGPGSYSTPQNGPYTELGCETVGSM